MSLEFEGRIFRYLVVFFLYFSLWVTCYYILYIYINFYYLYGVFNLFIGNNNILLRFMNILYKLEIGNLILFNFF